MDTGGSAASCPSHSGRGPIAASRLGVTLAGVRRAGLIAAGVVGVVVLGGGRDLARARARPGPDDGGRDGRLDRVAGRRSARPSRARDHVRLGARVEGRGACSGTARRSSCSATTRRTACAPIRSGSWTRLRSCPRVVAFARLCGTPIVPFSVLPIAPRRWRVEVERPLWPPPRNAGVAGERALLQEVAGR
jgi:hypothetical protein